jgi:hypothetical protein
MHQRITFTLADRNIPMVQQNRASICLTKRGKMKNFSKLQQVLDSLAPSLNGRGFKPEQRKRSQKNNNWPRSDFSRAED